MSHTIGKLGVVGGLTGDERNYIEKLIALYGRRFFKPKQCYRNSQTLILDDDEKRLRYWEGWLDDDIPHAWVTIGGKVDDVTLEAANRKRPRIAIIARRYFGAVVDRRRVRRHLLRTRSYEAVLPVYPSSGAVAPPTPGQRRWLRRKAKVWASR